MESSCACVCVCVSIHPSVDESQNSALETLQRAVNAVRDFFHRFQFISTHPLWCKPCCLDQIAQECFNTSLSVCLSTLPGSGILFFISELDIFTHHCFFLEMQLLYGKHESLYAWHTWDTSAPSASADWSVAVRIDDVRWWWFWWVGKMIVWYYVKNIIIDVIMGLRAKSWKQKLIFVTNLSMKFVIMNTDIVHNMFRPQYLWPIWTCTTLQILSADRITPVI